MKSCNLSPAIQMPGRTRLPVRFSKREAQRAGTHLGRAGRRADVVVDERQAAPLRRRLALHVDEVRGVRDRLEDDEELAPAAAATRSAFSPGGSSTASSVIFSIARLVFDRQVEAGAEEQLRGNSRRTSSSVGMVRRDAADARADGEGHLDHFVERRLVVGGADGAAVVPRRARVLSEALASSTPPQPGQSTFHDSSNRPTRAACRKAASDALGIEVVLLGEGQRVDPAQFPVGRLAHQALDRRDALGVGGLPQGRK